MAQQSWLSRKFAWWLVPFNAQTLNRDQWSIFLRLTRIGKSRTQRSRRRQVVYWIALLAFIDLITGGPLLDSVHRNLSGMPIVPMPFAISYAASRWMQFSFRATLADRATAEFGTDFHLLSESQRRELLFQQHRDQGRMQQDEREADLRLHAQSTAYHLLLCSLILGVVVYWIACQLNLTTQTGVTFSLVALVGTVWLASFALVLPTMIRMWTQPDDPGEPKLVSNAVQKEA